jgi:hypothetical protein
VKVSVTKARPSACARHTPTMVAFRVCALRFEAAVWDKPVTASDSMMNHSAYLAFMSDSLPHSELCGLASAAVAREPPRPIVSTADEGTITIEPLSLIAS